MRFVGGRRASRVTHAVLFSKLGGVPRALTSEVSGTLKTFAGEQVISGEERRFRFDWTYRGLRLALSGFAVVPPPQPADAPTPTTTESH